MNFLLLKDEAMNKAGEKVFSLDTDVLCQEEQAPL